MKQKKINVLQLIDSLNAGGAEMMAVNIANGLSEFDYINSFLISTRSEGMLKAKISKNVDYKFLDKKRTLDINALKKLQVFIKQNHIDIIHAHSSSYFFASLIKISRPSIKIIWHNHTGKNVNLKGVKFYSLKIFSSLFSKVIHIDKNNLKWGKKNLFSKKQILFINFAKFNEFSDSITKLKDFENKKIIHISGFRKEKDHFNLLKAFQKVITKHSEASLHLVGKIYDDDYSKEVLKFIKKNNLVKKVFLYGACPDISNILQQADIGVLSSSSEGLPVSLLEYGLAKLPVVTTNVGGISEVIKNNITGLLVPPKDSIKLAEALIQLLDDYKKARVLGSNLYLKVNNEFSEKAYLDKLVKLYQTI